MNKKKKRTSVKARILSITIIPLVVASLVISFVSNWILEDGLKSQVLVGLKSAATGALISLDSISGDSFRLEGVDLYKGDFNVSQNMDSLDYYAKSNNVEITFFYGDTRRATTIKDGNDKRIVGTKASDGVVREVVNEGKEYSSDKVLVNDEIFYGYYMPISDMEGKVIGMVFAGKPRKDVQHYIQTRVNFIVMLALVIIIICAVAATALCKKAFLAPIHKLLVAAQELAKGNINQTLEKDSDDEFGDLTDSFLAVMENAKNQAHAAERMADGDLTVSYQPVDKKDVMGHAIRKMIYDNNESLGTINRASDCIVKGVRDIASASSSLAHGAAEQAGAVEEITSHIEDIANSAEVNAQNASHVNELAKRTRKEAFNSNEQMKDMITAMEDINIASGNISGIMKVIDDIASQTNIISLNASVEAARAGVHGKGFAVVAEEIRNLANKSAEAAKNSAELIEDSMRKTAIGSKLASEAAASLQEILNSVEETAALINGIAAASEEQSASVAQVNTGILQISNVVQTNSATSEECAASAQELSQLAEQLKRAVGRYHLNKMQV